MESLESIVLAQPFFAGLEPDIAALIAGCSRTLAFEPDAYLFHEGEAAREFYLLREGDVALEMHVPGGTTLVLSTQHEGDVVGASWLIPPYRWNSDARARTAVRVLAVDAACLRAKCEADARTGYAMMKRFAPLLVRRLQAAQAQLLDVYGQAEEA